MIPLAPNKNTVNNYKTNLLNYINKRRAGSSEISSINTVLNSIEQNLTLDDLIVADYGKLLSLKENTLNISKRLQILKKKIELKVYLFF